MVTLLAIARHPFAAWVTHRREDIDAAAGEHPDRYATERSQRLAQLEAAGKCLARSGKHGNLRYWPSECGSRVLSEHRRRQRTSRTATHAL